MYRIQDIESFQLNYSRFHQVFSSPVPVEVPFHSIHRVEFQLWELHISSLLFSERKCKWKSDEEEWETWAVFIVSQRRVYYQRLPLPLLYFRYLRFYLSVMGWISGVSWGNFVKEVKESPNSDDWREAFPFFSFFF